MAEDIIMKDKREYWTEQSQYENLKLEYITKPKKFMLLIASALTLLVIVIAVIAMVIEKIWMGTGIWTICGLGLLSFFLIYMIVQIVAERIMIASINIYRTFGFSHNMVASEMNCWLASLLKENKEIKNGENLKESFRREKELVRNLHLAYDRFLHNKMADVKE
jgi:hypothetical protein